MPRIQAVIIIMRASLFLFDGIAPCRYLSNPLRRSNSCFAALAVFIMTVKIGKQGSCMPARAALPPPFLVPSSWSLFVAQ